MSQNKGCFRIAASHGPDDYVYHIDSRDKEVSSIPYTPLTPTSPPYDHSQDDRRASDVTAQTTAFVDRLECCGQWGHSTTHCRWSKHPVAYNTNRAFKNSHAGTRI